MHRIDTSGSIAGAFQDGNPATGQLATQLSAAWFNDLQNNVLALLAEGGVVPTKGRELDVVDAVKAIALGVGGGGGGEAGGVPATRKISVTGLLTTSGEDLSQDRTLTVGAATAAEVVAGVIDDKAITPVALAEAFNGAIGAGSVRVGALTVKWGATLGNYGEGATYIAFSQPFATECWMAVPVIRNDDGSRFRDAMPHLVGAPGREGFTCMVNFSKDSNATSVSGVAWIAIGR